MKKEEKILIELSFDDTINVISTYFKNEDKSFLANVIVNNLPEEALSVLIKTAITNKMPFTDLTINAEILVNRYNIITYDHDEEAMLKKKMMVKDKHNKYIICKITDINLFKPSALTVEVTYIEEKTQKVKKRNESIKLSEVYCLTEKWLGD